MAWLSRLIWAFITDPFPAICLICFLFFPLRFCSRVIYFSPCSFFCPFFFFFKPAHWVLVVGFFCSPPLAWPIIFISNLRFPQNQKELYLNTHFLLGFCSFLLCPRNRSPLALLSCSLRNAGHVLLREGNVAAGFPGR